MISYVFKVKDMNVHLGYNLYSTVIEKCIKNKSFTLHDMMSAKIISSVDSNKNKKARKKIYKAICNYLENIANQDYDKFINHYYNCSYHNENARENISCFLDGVGCVYKNIGFISDSNRIVNDRFPYGKVFKLCYNGRIRGNYTEIIIDINNISCFWGNLDCFVIHFKNGFSVAFNRGVFTIYMDNSYCE